MSALSFASIVSQLVEAGGGMLQLREGVVPLLLVGQQKTELSETPLSPLELEALTKVLCAGAKEPPEETPDGQLAGVFEHPEHGQIEFRIRTIAGARAIAMRQRAAETEETALAPPLPSTTAASEQSPRGIEELSTESIRSLLLDVVRMRASDLIVTTQGEASVRHGVSLMAIPGARFSEKDILDSLGAQLTPEAKSVLERDGNLDVAIELPNPESGKNQRYRANVFHHAHGLAAAFRPIWETIPSFEELNLPDSMRDLADFPHGLVLITGPTGAGKSTTLCSLLERVNRQRHCHIITLEDPIEFVFSRNRALVHQREVGVHVTDFAGGLRAALRENPDIILVGEMRDRETISAAITAAETGHLVLSTLHCGTAAQAMDRIIDIYPEHQQAQIRIQLADCLRAVVTQKLVPLMGETARIPAVEVLRVNTAVANMIRERKLHMLTSQMQTNKEAGMLPFDDSLLDLYRAGKISVETALRYANDPKTFRPKLGLDAT